MAKVSHCEHKKAPVRGPEGAASNCGDYCAHSRKAARLSGLVRCHSCFRVVRVASLCGRVCSATALAGRVTATGLVSAEDRGATVLTSSMPPPAIRLLSREALRWPRSAVTRSPVRALTAQLL